MSSKIKRVRSNKMVRSWLLVMALLFISVFLWGLVIWFVLVLAPNLGINPVLEELYFNIYAVLLAFVVLIISFGLFYWLLSTRLTAHMFEGG